MLFAWMGFLKPDANPIPQSVQQAATEFLSQPVIKIHMFGPLRGASGARAGMLMIFEHDNRAAAETFVSGSPFLKAGLYDDHRLYEYVNEAG